MTSNITRRAGKLTDAGIDLPELPDFRHNDDSPVNGTVARIVRLMSGS
jgi:hypothetical protein